MAISTTGDLNSLFNDIYDDSWFVTRESALMRELVTQREGNGMAPRKLSGVGQVTASTISEGGTPTANSFARNVAGTITPAINYAGYIITDEMLATDWQDVQTDAAQEAGLALAQQLDSNLVGNFSSFGGTAGAGGTAITLTDAQTAMALLANSAVMGQKYGVVGAGQWQKLSQDLTQTNNSSFAGLYGDVGNEAMRNFFVSNALGVTWFIDSNIGTTAAGGTAMGGVFTREAIILDERVVRNNNPLDYEPHRLEHGGGVRLNWRYRYGHGVRRADHGVALNAENTIS